jgi:hypothetical protein
MHRRFDAFRIAQHHSRTTDVRLVREFLREIEIPGRDGTVTLTGGNNPMLCPWTGLVVASGPCTGKLSLPGVDPLTMYGAWDSIQNYLVNSVWAGAASGTPGTAPTSWGVTTAGSGLPSTSVAGAATTFTVDGATGRVFYTQVVSVLASTTYKISAKVVAITGSMAVNEVVGFTSIPSGSSQTYGINGTTVVGTTLVAAGDIVSAVLVVGATPGTPTLRCGAMTSGTTFTAAAVTLTRPQVDVGAALNGYVPTTTATVTRSADSVLYTLASALSQDEELIHIGWQPYADGDMGITSQMWIEGSAITNHPRLIRAGATQLSATLVNNVSASITDSITRTLPNAGILFVQRIRVRPTEVEVGYGPTLSGSPTAVGTPPWNSQTVIKIGHSTTAGRASRAMNTVLRVRSPTTIREYQAKVDAFCRMVHLKRLAPAA